MTTSEARKSQPQDAVTAIGGRSWCTPGEDLVTTVLAACVVGGALSDAWAHNNIVESLESFFTPWHGLLYGGFAAIAIWTFWLALRRRDTVPRWWRDGWPVGYALGAVGVVGFMVGGVLDMIWHSIFGIETSLDAAFSPSHMLLSFSGVLLLTSPVRSWWSTEDGGTRAVAGVLSLGLGTVFGAILLGTYSPLVSTAPTRAYDHVDGSLSHLDAARGVGAYLIGTVVLVVPLLLVHRRRPTTGAATAIVALMSLYAVGSRSLPATLTIAAAGAIAGAVLADLAFRQLDAARGLDTPLRLPIAGGLFAVLVWAGHLLAMHLAEGLRWPAELVAGSVAFAAVIGWVLGHLSTAPEHAVRAGGTR